MSKKHMGSSVDDFLKEEGIFEEAEAVKEVVAWQLAEARPEEAVRPPEIGQGRHGSAKEPSLSSPTVRWWSKAVNRIPFLSYAALRTPPTPVIREPVEDPMGPG